MIVRRFLLWAREATPGDRAEAVGALARAYLYSDLDEDDLWEAETALTAMLDDRAAIVRRAMAEALASSADAPRHIVVALASDQADVAEIVLERSPILLEPELVDLAALGDARIQSAIARRPWVPEPVSAALAEIAEPGALVALAANEGAEIGALAFARMAERHGAEASVREALLARPDLPLETRQALAAALARQLAEFVTGCGWLSAERADRTVRDARERTTITLSASSDREDVGHLVAHLRTSGQLTPALILRAILSCDVGFAEAAFAELSQTGERRVAASFGDGRPHGFRAVYLRAGLPQNLRPVFEAALAAFREAAPDEIGAKLSRRMIRRALSACTGMPPQDAGRILTLLRRFEAEAALDEARLIADELADEAALTLVLTHAPEALLREEAGSALAA